MVVLNLFAKKQVPLMKLEENTKERRVVLFDLDNTLMDSGSARQDAWARALKELSQVIPYEKAMPAYGAIYNCHDEIKGKVGPRGHIFEDMRQEWNTRMSYALLIAWSEDSAIFPTNAADDYIERLKGLLNNDDSRTKIFGRAEEICDRWSLERLPEIDRAMQNFWNGNFHLYPGVTKVLNALREKGIEYYIATEGHVPTQWCKIHAIGLDQENPDDSLKRPWILPGQLLATSQAEAPQRGLHAVTRLAEWYRGRAAATKEAAVAIEDTIADFGDNAVIRRLDLVSQAADLVVLGLTRLTRLFKRLGEKSSKQAGRVEPEFYARVLYAINQAPEKPRDKLMDVGFKWYDNNKIRLAMVGDRFSADIYPIIKLSKHLNSKIMSIWVRGQGAHGQKDPELDGPEDKSRFTTLESIEQAGIFLLDDENWQDMTECISKPSRIFISAIEPNRELSGDVQESLDMNLLELLAAVGCVRVANSDEHLGTSPSPDVIKKAKVPIDELLRIIVPDMGKLPRLV